MNPQESVKQFLYSEFRREQKNGFELLRRIPCSAIRQFLDYYGALDKQEQSALEEALCLIALQLFFPSEQNPYQSSAAYKTYVDKLPLMWDWKYCSAQELRMFLAEAKRNPNYSSQARGMTPDVLKKIRAIKPVKSTDIRKVVKLALSQLFSGFSEKQEAGLWRYRGTYQNQEVCVDINYEAKLTQLRYEVSVSNAERGINLKGLTYERLMGISVMGWNCLEQANLDQSMALFKELILYCVELPTRLPSQLKDGEEAGS